MSLLPYSFAGPTGQLGGTWSPEPTDAGPPVLFIHPLNTDHRAWAGVAQSLRRPVVLPALRGHRDAPVAGPYGVDAWLEDLVAALDHLGIDRVHAVGGSLGGTLAVLLGTRHPDRVVSVASFGGTLKAEGNVDGFLELLQSQGVAATFRELVPQASLGPHASPEIVRSTLELVNPNSPQVVFDVLSAATATDVVDEVSPLGVPTLVATGEFDATCPVEQGELMAERLGVELEVVRGVGHLPMLEAPETTVALLEAHLARAGRPAAV